MSASKSSFLLLLVPLCGSAGVSGVQLPAFSDGSVLHGGSTSWWLNLPDLDLPGWEYDMGFSVTYHPSTYYRASEDSGQLGTRNEIRGDAVRKPDLPPSILTLNQYITSEIDVAKSLRDFSAEQLAPIKDGDGRVHPYFLFRPPKARCCWSLVAFGEEDDFYISIRLVAASEKDIEGNRADFEKVVAAYRKDIDMCAEARGRWRCNPSARSGLPGEVQ